MQERRRKIEQADWVEPSRHQHVVKAAQPRPTKKKEPVEKPVEKLADTRSANDDPFRNDAGNKTNVGLDELSNIEKNQVDAQSWDASRASSQGNRSHISQV